MSAIVEGGGKRDGTFRSGLLLPEMRKGCSMGLLDGKVCLVTGAGQGLGRSVCLEMAAEGATTVLIERNEQTAAAAAAEIKKSGGAAHPYVLDVTDYDRYGHVVGDVMSKARAH